MIGIFSFRLHCAISSSSCWFLFLKIGPSDSDKVPNNDEEKDDDIIDPENVDYLGKPALKDDQEHIAAVRKLVTKMQTTSE